jgi:hypothetical protein
MAAAMAGDIVAFEPRRPDFAQPPGDILARRREADIGGAGPMSGRMVTAAVLPCQQEDAGDEIGEGRAGLARQRPTAFPLREIVRAVEGDRHQLLLRLRRLGESRDGEQAGEKGRCET